MKYTILGPDGGIFRIFDTAPKFSGERTIIELTDEQADKIVAGKSQKPQKIYFWKDGEIITLRQKIALDFPDRVRPRKVTKLTILKRLDALGKWETFKYIMSTMPAIVQDSWELATEINDQDPLFVQNRLALMTALGLTEEQFDDLFA